MEVIGLSTKYAVRVLEESDISTVVTLCKSNPLYYQYCPPAISEEGIREDMEALPPGVLPENKYYVGFFDGNQMIAVMDYVLGYPDEETAYIGFFMMDARWQKKGIGTEIIDEVCRFFTPEYKYVRLAYVKENPQSKHFWEKNRFVPVGEKSMERYDVMIMSRSMER